MPCTESQLSSSGSRTWLSPPCPSQTSTSRTHASSSPTKCLCATMTLRGHRSPARSPAGVVRRVRPALTSSSTAQPPEPSSLLCPPGRTCHRCLGTSAGKMGSLGSSRVTWVGSVSRGEKVLGQCDASTTGWWQPPPSLTRLSPAGLSVHKDAGHSMAEGAALRTRWCCHCKVVILGSGVRKSLRDLAFGDKVLGRPFSTPGSAHRKCPGQPSAAPSWWPHGTRVMRRSRWLWRPRHVFQCHGVWGGKCISVRLPSLGLHYLLSRHVVPFSLLDGKLLSPSV